MHSLPALVLDRCPEAAFVIRDDGRFAYANRTACQWLHYRREELLELAVWDIDSHAGADDWSTIWQLLEENHLWVVKTEHVRRDGSAFPVEITATLEQFAPAIEQSTIQVAIAYARDISNPLGQIEQTVRSVLREHALCRLNGHERQVFELLEGEATEKDVTRQLNISRSTFYRIKRRITAKLGSDAEPRGFWW